MDLTHVALSVSIGNPFEPVAVGGINIPRHRLAIFGILGYVGIYFAYSTYSKLQPKKITYASKEEENFVKRYIHHAHEESHKPAFVREAYSGPSGFN